LTITVGACAGLVIVVLVAAVAAVAVVVVVVVGVVDVVAAEALVEPAFEEPPQPAAASVVATSASAVRWICNIVPSEWLI
jgi:hypothetical protein